MSVKEVMTNLANAARARYSVSDTLTVSEITNLIYSENADVAKLIDRTIDKIDVVEGVTAIGENAFRGCSQLTTVTLPSSIESIGDNAFAECGNLTNVCCDFYKDTVVGYPWGADASQTYFEFLDNKFLTLTAETAGSRVALTRTGSPTVSGLKYRTDNSGSWESYTIGAIIILAKVGDYVQFCNTENTLSTSASNYVNFTMTGKIAASGNVQSMLNWNDSCNEYCYYQMFYGCSSLTTAPELPATTLAERCYCGMFRGCASLTTSPELPATTLAKRCYYHMFFGCASLTTSPELPATTLADHCCGGMFEGCTSLTQAPELPATTLAKSCYVGMFAYCTSLTQAPTLPATTLADSCYDQMFAYCTSLTQAPTLPATTLAEYCYRELFLDCSKLSYINVGFTTWHDTATAGWMNNTAASGTFYKPDELPEEFGPSKIPVGWTVVNKD